MMQRKKILVNAYAISPTKGSEYSIGWTTINLLAQRYSVYVLYGTSGNTMGDTLEIDKLDKNTLNENIYFIKVQPGIIARNLNLMNSKLGLGFFFSFAFYFYQLNVYFVAKKLSEKIKFDLVHQLNPIGFREPGFLWLFDLPFVWGPISGIYILPNSLINWKDWNNALYLWFRNFVKWGYLKYSLRLLKVVKRADVILAATTDDSNTLFKYLGKKATVFPEHFIKNDCNPILSKPHFPIKLLWIGSIDARKNLSLLLDVLIGLQNYDWTLDIIGHGGLKDEMLKKVILNNLDAKITFRGQIPRSEVMNYFQQADLHVMTTLSDATTSVLFEAFENGVPTLSLNHCGMADVICEKCGFLVSTDVKNYSDLVFKYRDEVKKIIETPIVLLEKKKNISGCIVKYSKSNRIDKFESYYENAIFNFNQKLKKNG